MDIDKVNAEWRAMSVPEIDKRITKHSRSINVLNDLRNRKLVEETEPRPVHGSTAPVIITFTKQFTGSRRYHYAAVRIPSTGLWSVTGKTTLNSVPWSAVLGFIRDDERNPESALKSITRLVPSEWLDETKAKVDRLEAEARGEGVDEPSCSCGDRDYDPSSLDPYGH